MAVTLIDCDYEDPEVRILLDELLAEHRPDLIACEVKIGLLFAHSDAVEKPALKCRGQRVAGKCKINAYADRVEGKPDATITLDGDRWPKWTPRAQRALLHHEVMHIAHCDGESDEANRPILEIRHGDWEFDGFFDILNLYGPDSFEHANLEQIAEHRRQMTLPFTAATTMANSEAKSAPPVETTFSFRGRDLGPIQEAAATLRSMSTDDAPPSWHRITMSAVLHGQPGAAEILDLLGNQEIVTVGDLLNNLHNQGYATIDGLREYGLDGVQLDTLCFALNRLAREHGGAVREFLSLDFLGLEAEPPIRERANGKGKASQDNVEANAT